MKEIINPVSVDEIMAELTADRFVRTTNFGGNQIYSVTSHNSPAVMREIGRLRELAFRTAGGGTGKDIDIDSYDLDDEPYHQLVVWDPAHKLIMGGYRYKQLKKASRDADGNYILATSRLFDFTDTFTQKFIPQTLELGRSFVHPEYQAGNAGRKSLYALDNLWDGLGALIADLDDVKYLFGKVTMYKHYNVTARDLLLLFMKRYCSDPDAMLYPKVPVQPETDLALFDGFFKGDNYLKNYKILAKRIREFGENIPPLINAYLNISPTMRSFGTSVNDGFGGVEETGILITVDDIYKQKIDRHVVSYNKNEVQPPLVDAV